MNFTKKDKLTSSEKLEFLDYLKHSLENGFSLSNSIALMPALWPKKQALMQKLDQTMQTGGDFANGLLKLGFSKTTVTQIKMALQQGNLIECLTQIATLTRLKNDQLKKLRAELSYPFVLAGMMVILLVFMQTFVSSQFTQSQDHTGDYLLIGLIIFAIIATYYGYQILKLLSRQDYQSLKKLASYPAIGPVIKTYVNYLLVYDIGLLLASGFSLQKMCEYASKQEKGSLQQYLGQSIGEQLAKGKNLTTIVKQEVFLPDTLLIFLQTGAERSSLSKSCLVLGRSLFNELTTKIEKLVVNVQPLCFVLIGFCIIGMYLKLLLPMYAMMQGI
ncbi:type II secretion system protein F [Lactobacillus xujianguonis]|uniref:Type II secretion system protein F n=1 Tax=Lactobacillus xujianguonis TaxID=2495899 RepID=A0A437SWQ9_9LACO|nr:type II secretion system protein F [Lactobacillus xujianguonis]RVU74145.1 type II secretion system protein F [Lactobacillus xujianguonis]